MKEVVEFTCRGKYRLNNVEEGGEEGTALFGWRSARGTEEGSSRIRNPRNWNQIFWGKQGNLRRSPAETNLDDAAGKKG